MMPNGVPNPTGGHVHMTTQNLAALEKELNTMIGTGKAMEAFEKFYADNVVMQENFEPECVGKDANRARENAFFASVEQMHGGTNPTSAVGDDVTFSEWTMDLTFKGGMRVNMRQVARRLWKDGKVVHERFYYSKG